jgi:hypothetical protein
VLRSRADELKSAIDQELQEKEQLTGKESGDNSGPSDNSTVASSIRERH